MKNILIILIVLISINCYSQDAVFERITRYTYNLDHLRGRKDITTYILNPWNEHGIKFVFDVETDWEYDIYVYGKLFVQDDWEFIVRSKSSRIKYLDKFLYVRYFKLVSKSGAFTRIESKLFYE